jgi:ADP-heptose:LPS heptosyltransferase
MNLTLIRTNGMGDVAMALCAAKALRSAGITVTLQTDPQYAPLARACPHVAAVITQPGFVTEGAVADLRNAVYGIPDRHQVDAYLDPLLGHEVPTADKTLDLAVPELDFGFDPDHKVALLHPSTGDPNRTWPIEHWREIATWLLGQRFTVVQVGSNRHEKGVADLGVDGVLDYRDRTDFLEFVALCRQADLLVSCDGGPIQLAGASAIAIVGLYTVVRGRNRVPFRAQGRFLAVESPCPHFPCYERMQQPGWSQYAMQRIRSGADDTCSLFRNWCPAFAGHQCDITPTMVKDAIQEALS